MFKARKSCIDGLCVASGPAAPADPGGKPNFAKNEARIHYRVGLTILILWGTLNLVSCKESNTPADATPPTVQSVTPPDGASNVALNTNVVVSFSEPIDCTSVTTTSFTVAAAGPVSGNIGCSGSSATFTPASALSPNTTYTVTVSTDVRDLAGNALAVAFTSSYTSVPAVPSTPTGTTATPGNGQTTLAWPAVPGATSYNVYSSSTPPVTTASTKMNVSATGATLSALTNGTPIFAAVTAVNAGGESALSAEVCAVPTAASTAGLTLYDPLCGSTLDGNKWQTSLFSRSVSGGAMVLSTQVSNTESRTIRGLNYQTTTNVNAGAQRVTTLTADVTVPAATSSLTGNAEIRAMVMLAYQPPANRLTFPGGLLDATSVQIGLVDSGSGLLAFRRVFHCDNASCTSRSASGTTFVDPGGFTPNANGFDADAAAAYDTTYTVSASLNESNGVFTWSIAGGIFGAGVSGTADPGTYLAGNANWTALGANPLAGSGFSFAALRTQVNDESVQAGSDGSVSARFGNVQVGFNNAVAALWDDFSGTGANSGPTELSAAKWSPPGAGKNSMALTAGSMAGHVQVTSLSPVGINSFQAINFSNPAAINTVQADVTVAACSNSLGATNRAGIGGSFYNDGTPGTTPPNTNQPNSSVGDVSASLYLDCFFGLPRFQISRFDTTAGAQTILSNSVNQTVPMGPAPFIGGTHTLTMKWDPATHFFTFQVDGATPVVVDPTTVNAFINVAAPYAKPANSPVKNLSGFLFVPPAGAPAVGATASMDFKVNNVFTAP